jgi:hypothetical protein
MITMRTICVPLLAVLSLAACKAEASGGSYSISGGITALVPSGIKLYASPGVVSLHPYSGSLPALDLPIGPVAGTVFIDPAKGPLPAGCSYSAASTRPGASKPIPLLYCKGPSVSQPMVIQNLDLSLHGGVQLEVAAPGNCVQRGAAWSLTLRNSKFVMGPNQALIPQNNSSLVKIDTTLCTVDLDDENNLMIGGAPAVSPGGELIRDARASGNTTRQYDVMINSGGRTSSGPYGANGGVIDPAHNTFTFANNLVCGDDVAYPANTEHGEAVEFGAASASAIKLNIHDNVFCALNTQAPSDTALFWAANGVSSPKLTLLSVSIQHNLWIVPMGPGAPADSQHRPAGSITSARAFGFGGSAIAGPCSISSNYVYATGAWWGFAKDTASGISTCTFSSNVNLFDGSAMKGFDGYPLPTMHGAWPSQAK